MIKLADENSIPGKSLRNCDGPSARGGCRIEVVKRLECAFQRLILQQPDVLEYLADRIEEWAEGDLRFDQVCCVALSETSKRRLLEPIVRQAIPNIRQWAAQLRSIDDISRRRLHSQIVKLVESLQLRPRLFFQSPYLGANANWLRQEFVRMRNRYATENLGLVRKVALKICKDRQLVHDMIQEGALGLLHAIEKFDPTRGIRFSTYAVPWIQQAIFGALPNAQTLIRSPECYRRKTKEIRTYLEKRRQLSEPQIGREATIVAMACREFKLTPEQIRHRLALENEFSSLDHPAGISDASPLGAVIREDSMSPPDVQFEEMDRKSIVRDALQLRLTAQERRVVDLRFGLVDGRARSLAEVGAEIGVTRERVRQVEKPALKKLRNSTELLELGRSE